MAKQTTLKISDKWEVVKARIVSNTKKHLHLDIHTRFDGNGNSVVRYIVTKDGQETSYEKYDSAAGAYELLNMKG